jgi:hypothetical protein
MGYRKFKDETVLVQFRDPHLWMAVTADDGGPALVTQLREGKDGEKSEAPMFSPFILGKLVDFTEDTVSIFYRTPAGQGLEALLPKETILCVTRVVERRILDPNDTVG